MHKNYDWVGALNIFGFLSSFKPVLLVLSLIPRRFLVTSGGIGGTHDDITYPSIAGAFKLPLEHHDETIKRMEAFSKGRFNWKEQTEDQKKARLRMALFPKDQEYLFVQEDMWVPVVRVGGKVSFFVFSLFSFSTLPSFPV